MFSNIVIACNFLATLCITAALFFDLKYEDWQTCANFLWTSIGLTSVAGLIDFFTGKDADDCKAP